MLANVTLADAAELRAKVDLPFEKIRRVMYFESGFGWMGQHPLSFDPANQNWGAQVGPGNRAAIREHHEIYVWAVATDGLWSEYYPVKVGWDFVTRIPKQIEGALEVERPEIVSRNQ